MPAPGSTTTSAPSAFIFRTVSGVAATRSSAESVSRATAMRITPSPQEADAAGGRRLSTVRGIAESKQRDHHHDCARRPRSAREPMGGHDRREDKDDRQRDQPAAGGATDREPDGDGGAKRASHIGQLHETLVGRLVFDEVIAGRGRIFDLAVVRHRNLRKKSSPSGRGLAQMSQEGNGASAADLTFLQKMQQAWLGTSNRKAALESLTC